MQCKVAQIAYVKAKGNPMNFVQEAYLSTAGLQGDYHESLDDNLVVLVSKPLLEWMDASEIKGLCFRRFKYNICMSESISTLKSGDTLSCGESILMMSKRHKHCFSAKHPCDISNDNCQLLAEMKFAEIKQAGKISIDDVVTITMK